MQRGYDQREFSLMFAGALVAIAGAGLIAAYTLMVSCVGYLGHSYATLPPSFTTAYTEETWIPFTDGKERLESQDNLARQAPQVPVVFQ